LALGVGLLTVWPRWLVTGAVRASDLRAGLLWAIGLLVFIPFWSALRLKRQKRILKLSDSGLEIVIGDRTLHVPWSAAVSRNALGPGLDDTLTVEEENELGDAGT